MGVEGLRRSFMEEEGLKLLNGKFSKVEFILKSEISVNKDLRVLDAVYRLDWFGPRACFGGF